MEGRIGNKVSFDELPERAGYGVAQPPHAKTPLLVDVVARQQSLAQRARALAAGLQGEVDRLVGPAPMPSETYGPRDVCCYAEALDANADELTNALNAIENGLIRLQSGLG